jgi:vanillate O-demethylase monooxygenase subunit
MAANAPFPRNAWYMAGWSAEVGEALLRRRLLGDPVLLFRKNDGSVAALIDRCPHRFAPLSLGERHGDCVTCPYHGLVFDADGACVGNPFSGKLPAGAQVRTFPTAERDGIVWLWPGEPAVADPALIPDFSMLVIDGLAPVTGHIPMPANYEFGTDNLMDLSHIEFVHKGSFAGGGVIFAGEHSVRQDGTKLHSDWWMPDVAAPPHTFGIYDPRMRCDHWLEMRWQPPASMYLQIGACARGGDRAGGVIAHQAHILTPETAHSAHYFWASTRTMPPSEAGDAMLYSVMSQAFVDEDKPIIQAAYDNLDGADFWDLQPVFLGIDSGGTRARRLIQQLIAQERTGA